MNAEATTPAKAQTTKPSRQRETTPTESEKSGSATSSRSNSKNASQAEIPTSGSPLVKPQKYVSTLSTLSNGSASYLNTRRDISLIRSGEYSFIVFDAPTDHSVDRIVQDLKSLDCKTVVRTCQETYNPKAFTQNDVMLTSLFFPDGSMPSKLILKQWLKLVSDCHEDGPIGIHCVAGLGRSPLLVAIALIEFAALSAEQSMQLIRQYRRGAINRKQEEFIKEYEQEVKKKKGKEASKCMACAIM